MTKTWGEAEHKAPLAYDENEKKEPSKKDIKAHKKAFEQEILTGVGNFDQPAEPQPVEVIFDSKKGYKKV